METIKIPVLRISRAYRKGKETSLIIQKRETPHCAEDCTVLVERAPGKAKAAVAMVHSERCKQEEPRAP